MIFVKKIYDLDNFLVKLLKNIYILDRTLNIIHNMMYQPIHRNS